LHEDEEEGQRVQPTIDAVTQRAGGARPSRTRSALAAVVVGGAAAVLTYRLLRSADDGAEPD
jgi:hypothetical protein